MQRLTGDGFGHGMGAVEFPVANLVTCVIELRDDPSTAALDREHPIVRPVGDEDGGLPLRLAGTMNPGEKAIT